MYRRIYPSIMLGFLLGNMGFAQTLGRISGTLTTEDGTNALGAAVIVHKMTEYTRDTRSRQIKLRPVISSIRGPQVVPVSSTGVFDVGGLPGGRYKLCTLPPAGFLDNCGWSGPVDIVLPPGSTATGRLIRLRRGAVVRIRVNDPQVLLPAVQGLPGTHRLVVGVMTASNAFREAKLVSRDASGQDLAVTIPFDSPVRLWVVPTGVAVRAQDGRDILNAGAVTNVQPSRLIPTLNFQLQVISRSAP